MKCPMCEQPVNNPQQRECLCGENLSLWKGLAGSSEALRQRGLAQAAQGNFAGATLSFLEAALSNPMDQKSLIDAAKALVYCDCPQEAFDLLKNADARYAEEAGPVLKAIQAVVAQSRKKARDEAGPAAAGAGDAAPKIPVPEKATVPAAAPAQVCFPLLALGILKRRGKLLNRMMSLATGDGLPGIWRCVLQMENTWPNDWKLLGPWLTAAAGETARNAQTQADDHAVFHYMLGLGHVQAQEWTEASAAFRRCVNANPPVLNPAAYYLYLHLDDSRQAAKAMDWLKGLCNPHERADLHKLLRQRLANRKEADKAAVLEEIAAKGGQ